MTEIIEGDNVDGDKILGDKNVYNYVPSTIDIGNLRNICETNSRKIIEALRQVACIISSKNDNIIHNNDEYTGLDKKNEINGLKSFYEEFIEQEEQKLKVLEDFFKREEKSEDIEMAARNIKIHIFSIENRSSHILEPKIFNDIIQQHTSGLDDKDDKNIMTLIMFYLYRFCYIGEKQ